MIEPTDELRAVFRAAALTDADLDVERGLAAVLALVDRDYNVTPKLPAAAHRATGSPWWNHALSQYDITCTCGELFSGYAAVDASDRLTDHIEAQGGAS